MVTRCGIGDVRIQAGMAGMLMAGTIGLLTAASVGQAVQLRDGTVFFTQAPVLVDALTTDNMSESWSATYYFTVRLPENAGEPLRRLVIRQEEGSDRMRFASETLRAFEGESYRRLQAPLSIGDVVVEPASVAITFEPPVPAGKTLTIALRPRRNPSSGVYLLGVTAYPPGEQAHGQFLGFGRLHFYNSQSRGLGHHWYRR